MSVEQPDKAVVVSWILQRKNGVIKEYHVTYINTNDSSETKSRQTKRTEIQFDLKAGKTYKFEVGLLFTIHQPNPSKKEKGGTDQRISTIEKGSGFQVAWENTVAWFLMAETNL